MRIGIRRGVSSDTLEVCPDGRGEIRFVILHKGPVPHDAVHVFVERARPFRGLNPDQAWTRGIVRQLEAEAL
jgi:hypothetical protein